jgi:anti-sigma B factor antagonist
VDRADPPADASCSHCGRPLWFVTTQDATGATIVHFVKRWILEETDVREFGKELARLADGPRRILLNFANVQSLSSAALGQLLALQKNVTRAGGKLRLCGIKDRILEVFKITQLTKVLEIHQDEAGALASF